MELFYDAQLQETTAGHLAVFKLTIADGRVFVRALDAATLMFVNAKPLPLGKRRELLETDRFGFVESQVTLSPKYWLKPGIRVAGHDLVLLPLSAARAGTNASPGESVCIPSGRLTAIMGAAGCGKTLLLEALTGTATPLAGSIEVGSDLLVPGKNRAQARQIGYVPQHEVLAGELTVHQSLRYRLRLRFPDMAAEICERRITSVLRSLAIEPLLDRRIGAPDRTSICLSGGERRRVGLAHELIMRPEILFLDEPTTGLSADDAEQVVSQLRILAEQGSTVAVTIHQPPPKVFAHFQHLILMACEGRVIYCGPMADAVGLVERATGNPLSVSQGENPADYLIRQGTIRPDEILQQSLQRGRAVHPGGPAKALEKPPQTRLAEGKIRWHDHLLIFKTLMARSLRVFAQDATNFRIAALQIPAMALLILLAFFRCETDAPEYDHLNRAVIDVSATVAPYLKAQKPVPIEATIQEAAGRSDARPQALTELNARLRGAVVFALVAAAFWIGLLGACREMVMDKHLLRHECRTCAPVRPFLWAKLSCLGLVAAPQCTLLAAATAPFLLHVSAGGILGLIGALWLTALAAAGIGLLTAALAPSARAALTAVPLIMVPQLLFAGLLRPEAALASGEALPKWLGYASLQRWGFELALHAAPGQIQSVSLVPGSTLRIVDVLGHLKLANHSVLECFFRDRLWWPPIVVLLVATVLAMLLAEWHLRRKFHI